MGALLAYGLIVILIIAVASTASWWYPLVSGVASDLKPDDGFLVKPMKADGKDFDTDLAALLIHQKVNQARANAGLEPLAWNDDLAKVALAHSRDMATRNYYDHDSPEGESFTTRYQKGGINCAGSENLVYGPDVGTESQESQRAVSSWMGSDVHKENLLNSSWRSEGIGVALAGDVIYITQNFCA